MEAHFDGLTARGSGGAAGQACFLQLGVLSTLAARHDSAWDCAQMYSQL